VKIAQNKTSRIHASIDECAIQLIIIGIVLQGRGQIALHYADNRIL